MDRYTRFFKTTMSFQIDKPISSLVLMRLGAICSRHNEIQGLQADIAKRIEVSHGNFRVAIKELLTLDLVRKINRMAYMVSPEIYLEGTEKDVAITQWKWEALGD